MVRTRDCDVGTAKESRPAVCQVAGQVRLGMSGGRLMLEHDNGRAAAIVDYRHEDAPAIAKDHPSIRAITRLADNSGVPFFVVRYADDFSWWYPTPVNGPARALLPEARRLTERQWVQLLYRCRGRELPVGWERRA